MKNYFPISRGISSSQEVDLEIKDSFDKTISSVTQDKRISDYLDSLSSVINLYSEKFFWCNKTESWSIVENVNIQKYLPGGGYKIYHTERNGSLLSINGFVVIKADDQRIIKIKGNIFTILIYKMVIN